MDARVSESTSQKCGHPKIKPKPTYLHDCAPLHAIAYLVPTVPLGPQ